MKVEIFCPRSSSISAMLFAVHLLYISACVGCAHVYAHVKEHAYAHTLEHAITHSRKNAETVTVSEVWRARGLEAFHEMLPFTIPTSTQSPPADSLLVL